MNRKYRKTVIAGNWKMNKTPSETKEFMTAFKAMMPKGRWCDVALCVPAVCIPAAVRAMRETRVGIGAENCNANASGAYTGEIATNMLVDAGCKYSPGSTLAGCGPAFAAMFIEALADGAVKNGLQRPMAYRLASQMLVGTAKLQLESGTHPGAMKDAVCSPGGLTIKGVAALEDGGLRSAVISAIDIIEKK